MNHQVRKRPSILCAEDNPGVRNALANLFASAGHSVEFAIDGQDALDRLTARLDVFDILITDHRMPRLDGLSLVRRLRQADFPGRIIVFSSSLRADEEASYRELLVDGILTKPEDGRVLPETIDALFDV